MSDVASSSSAPLLQLEAIDKSFPGVKALSNVHLRAQAGEIHSLIGENGAGKSTLIKVLTGVYRADGGKMLLSGKSISPASPAEAEQCGISTVYQEVNLIPQLSVAENITLGRQPKRFGLLNWKAIRSRARQALERLGLNLDVDQPLNSYSIAMQQLVALARALDVSAKLLILDEPTSSLDAREVEQLFTILRKLKADGLGIVFVSHFLDQIYALTDRITILRNGQNVGEFATKELPRLELISRMIGKSVSELEAREKQSRARSVPKSGAPFLQAQGIARAGLIKPIDLNIYSGQVTGLAGLLGSGRTETARVLFGIDPADQGAIQVEGKSTRVNNPRQAIALRFGFCSEDRKTEGIIPNLSVRKNLLLALQAQRGWLNKISQSEEVELTERYIKSLNVMPADPERSIKFLSGGNQQKVLLGRWLAANPKFLILDEPTRGIDVGAKFEIAKLMETLTQEGLALLFISSEIEEVTRSCQVVVILRDRERVGELSGESISESAIMRTIAGEHKESAA